jgi:hypothetical protein
LKLKTKSCSLNGEDSYSNKPSNTILAKREKVNFGLIFLLKSSKSTYNIDQSQELMTHARINNKKGRERERPIKDKSERSNDSSGNSIPVDYQYMLAHPLVQSKLTNYGHPCGTNLQNNDYKKWLHPVIQLSHGLHRHVTFDF